MEDDPPRFTREMAQKAQHAIGDKVIKEAEKCANCRFVKKVSYAERGHGNIPDKGNYCRRYPPQKLIEPGSGFTGPRETSEWPRVHGHDWCGEFQAKEVK